MGRVYQPNGVWLVITFVLIFRYHMLQNVLGGYTNIAKRFVNIYMRNEESFICSFYFTHTFSISSICFNHFLV